MCEEKKTPPVTFERTLFFFSHTQKKQKQKAVIFNTGVRKERISGLFTTYCLYAPAAARGERSLENSYNYQTLVEEKKDTSTEPETSHKIPSLANTGHILCTSLWDSYYIISCTHGLNRQMNLLFARKAKVNRVRERKHNVSDEVTQRKKES